MTIDFEKEKLLFDQWSLKYPDINLDGIVDPSEYLAARFKLLFVLKETNGAPGLDIREFCRDGGRRQTWDNIARWTQGIMNVDNEYLWSDIQINDNHENEIRRKKYLKMICAINLKKTTGGYTANHVAIADAVAADRELLREQIDLYKAEYIICCGTRNNFRGIFPELIDWKQTSRGVEYLMTGDQTIISFAHPEARVADNILYYALVDAFREIFEMSKRNATMKTIV